MDFVVADVQLGIRTPTNRRVSERSGGIKGWGEEMEGSFKWTGQTAEQEIELDKMYKWLLYQD